MHNWQNVSQLCDTLADACFQPANQVKYAIAGMPTTGVAAVFYCPAEKHAVLVYEKMAEEECLRYRTVIKRAIAVEASSCPVSQWEDADGDYVKIAYSPTLRRAGELLNFFPGHYPGGIPNSPSPLAAGITSGLVGAGLGYGVGWLGEQLMPAGWRRGRLRKTMAMIGAIPGLAAGATWAGTNHAIGKDLNDHSTLAPAPEPNFDTTEKTGRTQFDDIADAFCIEFEKVSGDTMYRGDVPAISVNEFNQTIWHDPRVSDRMTPQMQGAASAAITAAQAMPGSVGQGWVTPTQMGRLAAGMGVGYLSGSLVGTALGLLVGAPDSTKDLLRQTGMYAGVVNAVIPKLFGN